MRLSILYLLAICASFTVTAADIPADKEIVYFQHSKLGTVTFLHKMHSELDGVECNFCHHTEKGENQPEACHRCHSSKPQDDTPKIIKAFHTRCRGCHQYTVDAGKKAGPVKKCTLCHVKPDREKK